MKESKKEEKKERGEEWNMGGIFVIGYSTTNGLQFSSLMVNLFGVFVLELYAFLCQKW